MKKLFKYTFAALLGVLGLASCTNEFEYDMATVEGQQVYFSNNQASTVNLSLSGNTFAIDVMRVQTEEAASVPVNVEIPDGSLITCDNTTAEFAAGENLTKITFSYDPEKMVYDKFETIKLSIGDETYKTPYGISQLTLSVGMPSPWTAVGTGKLTELYYFGIEPACDVAIQRSDLNPNLYRIQNPFPSFLAEIGESVSENASEWIYVRLLKKGEEVLGQTVNADDLVLFYGEYDHSSVNTGYTHSNYQEDLCLVFPGIFTKYSDPATWAQNRVLGYKEDGTPGAIQLAPYYFLWTVSGGWDQTQVAGNMIITFPDYVLADYSAGIEFSGRYMDSQDNGNAVFNVTLGADVAEAKVAMAPGKDPMEAYRKILAGAEDVKSIKASDKVLMPYTEGGDYVAVVVTYDAAGVEQNNAYTVINIPVDGAVKETFEALLVGDYTHGAASYAQDGSYPFGEPFVDEGCILYGSDQDETRYMISPWINQGYADAGTEGKGMIFTMDEAGTIVVDGADCAVPTNNGPMMAWDFITSGIANIPSYFDAENGVLNFGLVWSTESVLAQGGAYGFTLDTFTITGEASAKAKKSSRLNGVGMKKIGRKVITHDRNGRLVKANKHRKFNLKSSKTVSFKK